MNEELNKILEEVKTCAKCELSKTRTNAVPGAGSYTTKIMFIGEAPGFNEDQQGLPFVGSAGKILDELLESIGMARGEVFITNILKCRPPQNRNPQKGEIDDEHADKNMWVAFRNECKAGLCGFDSSCILCGTGCCRSTGQRWGAYCRGPSGGRKARIVSGRGEA